MAPTAPVAPPVPVASETAAAPSPPPAASVVEAPAPPAPPGPAPLTEAEQREAERSCKPLLDAIAVAKKKGGGDPLALLQDAMTHPPPGLPAAKAARCGELLQRGIRTYLAAAREVEAKVVLRQMGAAMAMAFESNGNALCPSSEHPIPADKALVAGAPYVSTEADWSTPAWKCLGLALAGQAQRFQYEVRTDAQGKTFEVIARGVPGGDGRWVELRQRGTVGKGGIEMGAVERR